MNTYLVTATFKNVALMGAAYDSLKVIEDGTLNDEFEGFKVLGIMPLYSNNVYIIVQAQQAYDRTFCSLES